MMKSGSIVLILAAMLVTTPALAQQATPAPTQAATPAATAAAPLFATTINLGDTKDFGKVLVGPNGLTLYTFDPDKLNTSSCYGGCAKAWMPLTVASASALTVADGIPGTFGTFARIEGTLQVTYNGLPLYYWFKDKNPGDTTGDHITHNWWVVRPATAYVYHDPNLGSILVGPTGMTLYMFTKDAPGVSNCTGGCAQAWPALTVKSADQLVPGVNLPGKFDTIKRDDGTLQVTYNGQALYYFSKDKAIGDTTGEAVGKTWYTVVPETVMSSSNATLGNILTSFDGLTLYTYSKDTAGVSACTGDCLKTWTPFTVTAADRLAVGTGVTGKLATFNPDPKTVQVTYNGAPLYFFNKDKAPGDANGQGADSNAWNVVKP